MALTTAYEPGFLSLVNGETAFATDDVYAILVSGYTFDAAHNAYSQISPDELPTGAEEDYEPAALAGKSVAVVEGKVVYDSNDISFGDPVSIGPADGIVLLRGTAASPQAADLPLFYAPLDNLQSIDAAFAVNTPNAIYEITIA